MEQLHWFYLGILMALIIGNSIAIGKAGERKALNWIQVIVYLGIIAWYVYRLLSTGLTPEFFFFSTLLFLLTLVTELWQFVIKQGKGFWDSVFLILSAIPIIMSIAILSGMFL